MITEWAEKGKNNNNPSNAYPHFIAKQMKFGKMNVDSFQREEKKRVSDDKMDNSMVNDKEKARQRTRKNK